MPTITLNKTVFEELVGKKLSLNQLKDRISMLGTDLEKIEGNEIQVEIFPNRPDMLSEQGFARAFSSFIGVKTGLRTYEIKKSEYKVIVDKNVTMRPYTACAVVKNLSFTDEKIRELMQIQEKLAMTHGRNRKKSAYGIYPLKEISFPIRYVAKKPEDVEFQPLGFSKKISAAEIPEVHPKGKAYKHLTEGWKEYPFFIDAKEEVMCMLPFTNSEKTGKVDEKTTEVFIECSGTNMANVQVALNIIVAALAEMGGEIYSVASVYPDKSVVSPNLNPSRMKLDRTYVNKILGLQLSQGEIKRYLERMGFGVENDEVLIPAYRADILHPVDLIEDIAIAYGYENFKEEIPNVSTIGEENPLERFISKLREILIGMKLLETKNYHLITKEQLVDKMNKEGKPIALKNALGDHNHLRDSLLPSLLKTLGENKHYDYPQNLFEQGRIFFEDQESETGVGERENIAVVLCHEKTDFTEMRQIIDALIRILGLDSRVKEISDSRFIEGRAGDVLVGGRKIGVIGEFHPQVLENWGLLAPAVGMELDVEDLWKIINSSQR